jgi:hypothetical protein
LWFERSELKAQFYGVLIMVTLNGLYDSNEKQVGFWAKRKAWKTTAIFVTEYGIPTVDNPLNPVYGLTMYIDGKSKGQASYNRQRNGRTEKTNYSHMDLWQCNQQDWEAIKPDFEPKLRLGIDTHDINMERLFQLPDIVKTWRVNQGRAKTHL